MSKDYLMSDDRLFASNNAIGRKWYFINLFILAVVSFFTNLVFTDYIIPNVTTDVYNIIAKGILYFLFLIYLITFFALIDRRLYDVFGTREVKGYKNIDVKNKVYNLWKAKSTHPYINKILFLMYYALKKVGTKIHIA